jgi:predicted permease
VGFTVTMGQVALMFAFIGLGVLAARLGWTTQAGPGLTQVIMWFVFPAVILNSFNRPFSWADLGHMGIAFAFSLVSYVVTILLANLIFGRWIQGDVERRALRFATVYSNAGFLGIPLVQALIGPDGVFYAVTYSAAFTLFTWTHGYGMFAPTKKTLRARLRPLLVNPNILALVLGLVLFMTSLPLPTLVTTGLNYLSAMNAPLSMLVIGISVSVLKWRDFLRDGLSWLGTAVRNVVFPLLCLGGLTLVPLPGDAKLALLILMSCPAAAFVVMFSVMARADTAFPTRFLCVSTLIGVVTIPGVLALAEMVWA